MLIGLALQFPGKKIISLDKRFLLLWRFWALYPNTAVAGGRGNCSLSCHALFLAIFISPFACCPMMVEGLPSILFTAFPSGVTVFLSSHQYKEKLRKKGGGLGELMSVLLSQCCCWYYRASMLLATDCVDDEVTRVQETLQYFRGWLCLLHMQGFQLLLRFFIYFSVHIATPYRTAFIWKKMYLVAQNHRMAEWHMCASEV